MSRTWMRLRLALECGSCRRLIGVGEPALEVRLDGVTWERLRCVTCAGEPPPADLPPLVPLPVVAPVPKPRRPTPGVLPLDVKARQFPEGD